LCPSDGHPISRGEVPRSVAAEVGLGRSEVVPIRLDLGSDRVDRDELVPDVNRSGTTQELLDDGLGAFVVALAEPVMPDAPSASMKYRAGQ
jgi:hypothetical protein